MEEGDFPDSIAISICLETRYSFIFNKDILEKHRNNYKEFIETIEKIIDKLQESLHEGDYFSLWHELTEEQQKKFSRSYFNKNEVSVKFWSKIGLRHPMEEVIQRLPEWVVFTGLETGYLYVHNKTDLDKQWEDHNEFTEKINDIFNEVINNPDHDYSVKVSNKISLTFKNFFFTNQDAIKHWSKFVNLVVSS